MDPAPPQFAQLKSSLKSAWMAGDFGEVAKHAAHEGEAFVGRLGLKPGQRVLDVACGTGNTAIPAARTGADVVGVDIATNLLDQARGRASAEKLPVKFKEGDAEDLPFGDAEFDIVISMFGAMFAPRPERVSEELLRVCKPAGVIAMANWTPTGFVGKTFRATAPCRRESWRSCARARRWSSRSRSTRPTWTSPRTSGASRSRRRWRGN